MLNLYKATSPFIIYKVKPQKGWDHLQNMRGELILANDQTNKTRSIVINKERRILIDNIYVKRVYNWCIAKFNLAKMEEHQDRRMDKFLEIIDYFVLISKIGK